MGDSVEAGAGLKVLRRDESTAAGVRTPSRQNLRLVTKMTILFPSTKHNVN